MWGCCPARLFVFAAEGKEAALPLPITGNVSLNGLDARRKSRRGGERGMWQALMILGGVFAAFLAAFLSFGWGRLARNPERRNPWIFFDPGGGGS